MTGLCHNERGDLSLEAGLFACPSEVSAVLPNWPKSAPPHKQQPAVTGPPECESCTDGGATKTELAAELAFALADMRNVPHIIEPFSTNRDDWTEWSDSHDFLNSLLDEWQAASDG